MKRDRVITFGVISLIVLGILCEIWLAPLRPGGSWLVLKTLPLIVLVPGLWRAHIKSQQWLSLIILLYVAEGVVRGMSDAVPVRFWGWIGAGLSTTIFLHCLYVVKQNRLERSNRDTHDATARTTR
jgi:uncharacterized membrane protein